MKSNLFHFAILLIPLLLSGQSSVDNDNYCDDVLHGRDEWLTSACSGAASSSSLRFTCLDSSSVATIPLSRVHDGVCDCCDGSDEKEGNVLCLNTCRDAVRERRAALLSEYNTLQAGLQKKREFELQYQQKKRARAKEYLKAKEDLEKIKRMIWTMGGLIEREERVERKLRFKLIRERQNQCALGVEEMCHLFASTFLTQNELMEEGIPDVFQHPKKRFITTTDIEAELKMLQSLEGVERVEKSICPHNILLPEDSLLLWRTVGEYLLFMNTTTGMSSLTPSPLQRRKDALFGPYLEEGRKGEVLFRIHVFQLLGILLSPLTLSSFAVMQSLHKLIPIIFQSFAPAVSPAHTCESSEDSQCLPRSTLMGDFLNSIDQDITDFLSSSLYQNVLPFCNPYRYSLVLNIINYLHPYTQSIRWAVHVAITSPWFLYDVLVLQKQNQLPPRRQACLLREGLLAATKELISTERKVQSIEAGAEEEEMKGRLKSSSSDQHLWELLRGECVSKESSSYMYTFCFFGSITQNHVTIGRYKADTSARGDSYSASPWNVVECFFAYCRVLLRSLSSLFSWVGVDNTSNGSESSDETNSSVTATREELFKGGDHCYKGAATIER